MIFVNTPYNRIYEVFALEYWLATEKDLGDDVTKKFPLKSLCIRWLMH